tara:strand:+ start:2686 stop:2886 length:201 start_codon:yes stop_codon:yes gene_type:complete
MKNILYKVNHVARYTLCGSCDKGVEWEYELDHAPSYSLCYCTHDSYTNLIKQFVKRKMRRKDEPIF